MPELSFENGKKLESWPAGKLTAIARKLSASSSDSRLALVAEAMADVIDEYDQSMKRIMEGIKC